MRAHVLLDIHDHIPIAIKSVKKRPIIMLSNFLYRKLAPPIALSFLIRDPLTCLVAISQLV